MKILGANALINKKGLSHEEWLAVRRKGIGGSDAGGIVKLNPHSSPYMVYADKLGLIPEREDSEAMRLGRDLEEYVARRFCEETGKKVKNCNYMLVHPQYKWLLANVDRLVVGENAGLECKTTSVLNLKRFKGGEYPEEYYAQCMHYMAVTGAERWYLCVLVLGKEVKTFTIERDEKEIASLMALESEFWTHNVLAHVPPEPIGLDAESDIIGTNYPQSNADEVDISEYDADLSRFLALNDEIKALEREKETIKQRVQLYMGEAGAGRSEAHSVSWNSYVQSRLDSEALKADLPNVYAKYAKESALRRFTVK